VRSVPGERAKLVGIVYVANGSDYVTLASLAIEGPGDQNTIQVTAAHVIVEDSSITNAWRGDSCMILGDNDGWGQAVRPIVRRNRFHECGSRAHGNQDHAIYAANVVDGQIVGNVFWNTASFAIQLYPNAQRTRFAHNVVDGAAPSVRGGVLFGGDDRFASSNNVVERNVIAYAQSYNIDGWWEAGIGSGNIARNNCLWAGKEGNIDLDAGFRATGNLVADPLFVNRKKRHYRLGAKSRCRRLVGYENAAALTRDPGG
jgi:Right handed beta helix region